MSCFDFIRPPVKIVWIVALWLTLANAPCPQAKTVDSAYRQHQQRSLQGKAICSLNETVLIAYQDANGMLTFNAPCDSNTTADFNRFHGTNRTINATFYESVAVKQCQCAKRFRVFHDAFGAEDDYCPAALDMCRLRKNHGAALTMTCYASSQTRTHVRILLPVILTSLLALAYFVTSTTSGRLARQYARRTFRWVNWCCRRYRDRTTEPVAAGTLAPHGDPAALPRTLPSTSMLDVDLDALIEQEPEQAAMLYRQYRYRVVDRARRLRLRFSSLWYRGYQWFKRQLYSFQRRFHTDARPVDMVAPMEPGDVRPRRNDGPPTTRDPRARLTLKTKVFSEPTTSTASNSRNLGLTSASEGSPLSTLFPHPNDRATMAEMDDELEHGTRCPICLVRLRPGDLVGDISCNHAMHKDCLKAWLSCRNQCPLCQQGDIAVLSESLSRLH